MKTKGIVFKYLGYIPERKGSTSQPNFDGQLPELRSHVLASSMQFVAVCSRWCAVIHSFFIRTSKFCLRLAVLNFFFIFEAEMFLICSYFPD